MTAVTAMIEDQSFQKLSNCSVSKILTDLIPIRLCAIFPSPRCVINHG